MSFFDRAALLLVIVGAINWGSVGIFKFDFVQALCGDMSALSRIIFALVGIEVFGAFRCCSATAITIDSGNLLY